MTSSEPKIDISPDIGFWRAWMQDGEARRILLKRFEIEISMGIHDFERAAPQRFWVSVDLLLNGGGPQTDELDQVLDYDFLRREITALAQTGHFNLQETFVEKLAEICLLRAQVAGVRVRTEKPDVYADTEAVGFELIRMKEL